MRCAAATISIFLASQSIINAAYAEVCIIPFHRFFLPALHVDFHDFSSGAKLTLPNNVAGEGLVLRMDREIGTIVGSQREISYLIGTETIKSANLIYQVEGVLNDVNSRGVGRGIVIK